MASLIFMLEQEGAAAEEVVVPIYDLTTVGSVSGNNVVVDDPGIAEHHAEVFPVETGGFYVRDVGSLSGTFVNGRPVLSMPLRHGDEVAFGPLVARFLFADEDWEELRQREVEFEANQKQLAETTSALGEAKTQQVKLSSSLEALRGEERKLRATIETAQNEAFSLSQKNAEATAKLGQVSSELIAKQQSLTSANQQLQSTESTLTERNQELAQFKSEKATLSQQLFDLRADISIARVALQGTRGEHASIEQQRQLLADERQQQEQTLREVKAEHARLLSQAEQAASALTARQGTLDNITESVASARQQLTQIRQKTTEAEIAATKATERQRIAETAAAQATADSEQTKLDIQSIRDRLNELREEEIALVRRVEVIRVNERKRVEEHRRAKAEFEAHVEARQRHLQDLETRIANHPYFAANSRREEAISSMPNLSTGIVVKPKTSIVVKPRSV